MSKPPSHTWQVSRHTPRRQAQGSWGSTASMIARSSSKVPPTSDPLPDIVSRRIVVAGGFGRRERMRTSIEEMSSTPFSAPCPTWLPGWKL